MPRYDLSEGTQEFLRQFRLMRSLETKVQNCIYSPHGDVIADEYESMVPPRAAVLSMADVRRIQRGDMNALVLQPPDYLVIELDSSHEMFDNGTSTGSFQTSFRGHDACSGTDEFWYLMNDGMYKYIRRSIIRLRDLISKFENLVSDGEDTSGDDEDTPNGDDEETPSGDDEDTPSGDDEDTPSGDDEDTPSGDDEDTPSGDDEDTPSGDDGVTFDDREPHNDGDTSDDDTSDDDEDTPDGDDGGSFHDRGPHDDEDTPDGDDGGSFHDRGPHDDADVVDDHDSFSSGDVAYELYDDGHPNEPSDAKDSIYAPLEDKTRPTHSRHFEEMIQQLYDVSTIVQTLSSL
jgi:hypothetical protein